MLTVQVHQQALSNENIAKWLAEIRKNAYAPFSNFAVAVILEVHINDQYYYFAGVNVESKQCNRISLHAEQTALNTMVTCLGPRIKLSRAFFMGALIGTESTREPEFCWPCGACRQILLEFATSQTLMQPVALNHQFATAKTLAELLPETFSAANLGHQDKPQAQLNPIALEFFLSQQRNADIPRHLAKLNPHILDKKFQTTAYSRIIVECEDKTLIPGVLMQNAAFLTTEPIVAAVGNAVSRYGKSLSISKLHVLQPNADLALEVSPLELDFARQFGPGLTLRYYQQANAQFTVPKAKL